jgi:hypothetical protein
MNDAKILSSLKLQKIGLKAIAHDRRFRGLQTIDQHRINGQPIFLLSQSSQKLNQTKTYALPAIDVAALS